jgi:hypothetical protein
MDWMTALLWPPRLRPRFRTIRTTQGVLGWGPGDDPVVPRTRKEVEAAHRWVAESLARWGGLWETRVSERSSFGERCHECLNPPDRRVAVNVWGTGVEWEVCANHAFLHGKGSDG